MNIKKNPNHIDAKLTFVIPYGTTRNGTNITKEAIENALANLGPIPIVNDNSRVIGLACGPLGRAESVVWDDENQLCRTTINGVLYDAVAEIYPYEIVDEKITRAEIVGISLNEIKENNYELERSNN